MLLFFSLIIVGIAIYFLSKNYSKSNDNITSKRLLNLGLIYIILGITFIIFIIYIFSKFI